ncbi:MAG TPA: CBS domain-containing protein [Candidatus Acidoferrales bacterium]|jgi:CBS domain-containing protein|nr:CBS domain-containing protein [Candidatus Acidoferrales bacterium]
MLHATDLLGGEAYDRDGHFVGQVTELFIEPADQPNRVARILLGRGKFLPLIVRYDNVAFVAPGVIRLNVEEKDLEHYQPNEAWLAMRKDLLDQQIIDTSGRKVVRVNDIDMAEQRVNGTVEMRVTQVDVGLTGAARRLLHGVASPGVVRGLTTKLPTRVIPWEFVNLIESDPLRRVKLRITHQKLEKMHPADLADIMEDLSPNERQSIIASLDEQTAAEALAELDKRLTTQIVETLTAEKAADILEEMDPDQAADVIADMTPEKSRDVLSEMPGDEAREVRELLKFDENSAGGMMNTDFIYVGEAATRDEVVSWIQEKDVDLERLDTVFLIDREAKFSGAVAIGRLLLAASDELMETLKMEPLLSITPDADDKEVFELFDKYNLHSLAVVDDLGRPIGAIEVDDVVSRIRHR